MALGLLLPTGSQRVRERSAGDTAAILFARPAALLDALLVHGSSPTSSCKLAARRLLIHFPPRFTVKAKARCPLFGHVKPAIPGHGEVATGLENWRRGVALLQATQLGSSARMGQQIEKSDLETGGGRREWKNTWLVYKGG